MTVNQAIERASLLYPSSVEQNDLYAWLSELEARICTEIHGTDLDAIISDKDGERVLTAPDAYAELYPLYLAMKTDLANGDVARYNNHASVFNSAYSDYANYCNRSIDRYGKTFYTLP